MRAQGLCLFHAGDFNLWHWREESTPQEIQEAYALYEAVLQPLLPYGDHIDIAFFPVDPRMGKTTMEGALDFAAKLRPRLTVPMHMQGTRPWAWPSNGHGRAGQGGQMPAPSGRLAGYRPSITNGRT